MKWTDEEIKILQNNRGLNSVEMCNLLTNRSYDGIVQKRNKLSLQWTGELPWQGWEVELLAVNQHLSTEAIANSVLPHRTEEAVKSSRQKFKLPHLVRCNKCGSQFKKNNQHDICKDCCKSDDDYNSSISHKYSQYKHGAKRRGYAWSISVDEFISLVNADCNYCGDEIDGIGIDRVDNNIGYTDGNCVPCCETCNRLKMALNLDDWISHMTKIVNHLGEDK